MVTGKEVAAGGGDCLELVIWEAPSEMAAGGGKGVIKVVVRIVHTVNTVDSFKATFVKPGVMGN